LRREFPNGTFRVPLGIGDIKFFCFLMYDKKLRSRRFWYRPVYSLRGTEFVSRTCPGTFGRIILAPRKLTKCPTYLPSCVTGLALKTPPFRFLIVPHILGKAIGVSPSAREGSISRVAVAAPSAVPCTTLVFLGGKFLGERMELAAPEGPWSGRRPGKSKSHPTVWQTEREGTFIFMGPKTNRVVHIP